MKESFIQFYQGDKLVASFEDKEAAIKYFKIFCESPGRKKKVNKVQNNIAKPDLNSISIGNFYEDKTKFCAYWGVYSHSREMIFYNEFDEGNINIMELLAIVGALKHCKTENLKIPIYSNSAWAIKAVKERYFNLISPSEKQMELNQSMINALQWLQENSFCNQILEWDKNFGSSPAELGE